MCAPKESKVATWDATSAKARLEGDKIVMEFDDGLIRMAFRVPVIEAMNLAHQIESAGYRWISEQGTAERIASGRVALAKEVSRG